MGDLDRLADAAHDRGLRVIADLVVNHTSDEHRWFQSSRRSQTDDHRSYYIWRDPVSGRPPNNWLSHFGGPAWTFDAVTGQYYLHLFTSHQPDLNWDDPRVANEVDGILTFWFNRGLDGFRIDVAHYLVKADGLPDNPARPAYPVREHSGVTREWLAQDHRHELGQPRVLDIHRRWRNLADRHRALLVGEVYEFDPERLATYAADRQLHSVFWFGLVESGWDPARIATGLRSASSASPRLAWVASNHDQPRAVTRYGGGELGRRRALAVHVLLVGLPGMFYLYQGEELGLDDGHVPPELAQDPLAAAGAGRDGARTPFPWHPGPGLGFTSAMHPWLPVGDRRPGDTATVQAQTPSSSFAQMRRLLHTRRRLRLNNLPLAWIEAPDDVVAYQRGDTLIAANLGATEASLGLKDASWEVDYCTTGIPGAPPISELRLAPLQAAILTGRSA